MIYSNPAEQSAEARPSVHGAPASHHPGLPLDQGKRIEFEAPVNSELMDDWIASRGEEVSWWGDWAGWRI